jgi:flagellar P-ring protein precursor FlgI
MSAMRTFRLLFVFLSLAVSAASHGAAKIKDLGRFDGERESAVIGYGLVVGLSGTGDSRRSLATVQSVSNMLREFGLQVPPAAVNSRNVAAVLVTTNLPGFINAGDRLDVNVSSIGDASSLAGGTLLMTPLLGPDRSIYALAQGSLSIGGFRFEQNGTVRQKNHPTSGNIPEGAIAERSIAPQLAAADGTIDLILNTPDFTTATRVASTINSSLRGTTATPVAAGRVRLSTSSNEPASLIALMASVENLSVEPDTKARVVVNERTGTVVAGGDVWLSAVTITQGDIQVSIDQEYLVSQPEGIYYGRTGRGVRSVVVPQTTMDVKESETKAVKLAQGATIADLVTALTSIKASSRDVIAVLQAIKRAGALHAELIIQ